MRCGDGLCGLILALALLVGSPAAAGEGLEYLGRFAWEPDTAAFGGISGLEVMDGGAKLMAVSDAGYLARATVTRAGAAITAVRLDDYAVLRDEQGGTPRSFLINSEGLALCPTLDTGFFVAFEGWARVVQYQSPDQQPTWLHVWDRFWTMIGNEGFEALACDATGGLWAITTMPGPDGYQVYRSAGARLWVPAFTVPAGDGFVPTGADFGPDGTLYVVERRVRVFGGFTCRIRRLTPGAEGIADMRILPLKMPGWLNNCEAVSVWRTAQGQTRITLATDDNFNWFQRSWLIEFAVVP